MQSVARDLSALGLVIIGVGAYIAGVIGLFLSGWWPAALIAAAVPLVVLGAALGYRERAELTPRDTAADIEDLAATVAGADDPARATRPRP